MWKVKQKLLRKEEEGGSYLDQLNEENYITHSNVCVCV